MKVTTFCAIILALCNLTAGHKVWLDCQVRAYERELLVGRLARQADNLRFEAEMAELDRQIVLRTGTVSTKVGPCPTGP